MTNNDNIDPKYYYEMASPMQNNIIEAAIVPNGNLDLDHQCMYYYQMVIAMQNNIGTYHHRLNDTEEAMKWYCQSIRTRRQLYEEYGVESNNGNRKRRRIASPTDSDDMKSHLQALKKQEASLQAQMLNNTSSSNRLPTMEDRLIGLNYFSSPLSLNMPQIPACVELMDADKIFYDDCDGQSATTLFNLALLHQQGKSNFEASRKCLELAMDMMPASIPASPAQLSCLSIMLHTNLGYLAYCENDNVIAISQFQLASSHASLQSPLAQEQLFSTTNNTQNFETSQKTYTYCLRAEIATLLNLARAYESESQFELALEACSCAMQRLRTLPSPSSSQENPQGNAHEEEDGLDLSSGTFVMANIMANLDNDDEALALYASFYHHIEQQYGQRHPYAVAALQGIGLVRLRQEGNMNQAAAAA